MFERLRHGSQITHAIVDYRDRGHCILGLGG
jgi:hypothetical protein